MTLAPIGRHNIHVYLVFGNVSEYISNTDDCISGGREVGAVFDFTKYVMGDVGGQSFIDFTDVYRLHIQTVEVGNEGG